MRSNRSYKEATMISDKIVDLSVTPVPVSYRKDMGKNAFIQNRCRVTDEWLVIARTESGLEGITNAGDYFKRFKDFSDFGGSLSGLVVFLRETLYGRRIDELLEIRDNRVIGASPRLQKILPAYGWITILACDLAGKALGISCTELLGGKKRDRVDAYDTTLYYQDLVFPQKGVGAVVADAVDAVDAGYRQMKMKIGRCGRWMLPQTGLRRDIDVVMAVHEAVGEKARIMVDANFGYDGHLDLLEDFVRETSSAGLFWLEEMVSANLENYHALREYQAKWAPGSLLVCGEVDKTPISPPFRELIAERLIDGYQPDLVTRGFTIWQEIERELADTGVRSIPHCFGNGVFGTYATLIFGAASPSFITVEDERCISNIYNTDVFAFENGSYRVPESPGLSLTVNAEALAADYAENTVGIK